MHVLIVDDNDIVRQILIRTVKLIGYNVLECVNGREAMHHLHTCNECPGLIFLDVMMPVMGGWEVLQQIQSDPHLASIPIVMMSASGDYAEGALAHGAVHFLPKPFPLVMVMDIRALC